MIVFLLGVTCLSFCQVNAINLDVKNLRTTYGMNPFGSKSFFQMPTTIAEAISQGWTKERDCSSLNANRFILNGDKAQMLLFNQLGLLVGISSAIPKNLPFNYPGPNIRKYFNDEGDFWSISAFFTEPSNVCSQNVSTGAMSIIGDRLLIVSNQASISLPLLEKDVTSFWTKGKCFWTMGQHYWGSAVGQVDVNTKVEDFLPFFLMYNHGELNVFGFLFNANLNSIKYEHPSVKFFPFFTTEVPNEFKDPTKAGILTSMHIYFDKRPLINFC